MPAPLLEVVAVGPADAEGAEAGGADRLVVMRDPQIGGLTPLVQTVRDLRRASSLPVRAVLRSQDGFTSGGSDLTRLQGAALELAAAGVEGFVFGFLGPSLDIDVDTVEALLTSTSGLPWTFNRAVDHTLNHDRAWRTLGGLAGLDTVMTAGSARGVSAGLDDLCRRASSDAGVARVIMASGGLLAEHVPWLVRAGIVKFNIAADARPAGHWKSYVDATHVRSWRTLVDDAFGAVL